MMTERECHQCGNGEVVTNTAWPKGQLRCMRPARFRNGDYDEPLGVGRSAEMERDAFKESHRWPHDKCGPDGRNWKARG